MIVEGKNDYSRIKQIYPNIPILITNGSAVSDLFLEDVKKLSVTNEMILFLDPDYPGEKIRKKLMEVIPNATHVFVNKKDAISKNKKKVGVEHVSTEILKEVLECSRVASQDVAYEHEITMHDLIDLGLVGEECSKNVRIKLCEELNIGYTNSKQLVKRLNMFHITKKEMLEKLRSAYDWID